MTLPGRRGTLVLVPRGHGDPVLAVERGGQFRELATNVVCSGVRWEPAGSVAAWLREVPAPRPSAALGPASLQAGAFTLVRVQRLALTAARVNDSTPTVVGSGRRVRAANAGARAKGIGPGTPLVRATALGVNVVPAGDEEECLRRLGDQLGAEYGECTRVRGGFVVHGGPMGPPPAALAVLAHLRARLWQQTGLTVSVVSGPEQRGVMALGRHLPAGHVALIPTEAAALWDGLRRKARVRTGAEGGLWEGEAMIDVEGVVSVAQALVWTGGTQRGAPPTGPVRMRLWSDRGVLSMDIVLPPHAGRTEVHSRVELAVRSALGGGTAVWAVAWRTVPNRTVAKPLQKQISLWV
ncbi:MAG: hypothetical protein EXR69_05660 [Myxococcales bacterium]|nr:hypothetical protein [Myxococcales bacterium]